MKFLRKQELKISPLEPITMYDLSSLTVSGSDLAQENIKINYYITKEIMVNR